jgi:2-desacetyl-2-hydroxyethyl bacteriochlorophyllide A dehydrogenase
MAELEARDVGLDSAVMPARAVWFPTARSAELRAEVVAPPGPHEVRIQAICSGISQGTEMLVYRGQVPRDLPLDLPTLAGRYDFPIKYGYASVGRVVDVGTHVTVLTPGDLVFTLHPHQDVYVVPADWPVRLSGGVDPVLGVFVANLDTAVGIVHDTPLSLGETALVFGQGVVGLLVAQLLKLAGARRVVGVEPSPLRRDAALAIGVDAVLAPDDDLANRVRALNERRPADIAVEVSGAPSALQSAVDAVADEGTVVAASWYGAKPVTLSLGGRFHRGRVTVRSSQVGRMNPSLSPRWDRQRRLDTVLDLLPTLKLADLVTHRFPLEAAAEAYRLVDEHPEETIQVVFFYDKEGPE